MTWVLKKIDTVGKMIVLGDEFIPVVSLDRAGFATDKIASITTREAPVALSSSHAPDQRQKPLYAIITSPGELEIPFMVERGRATLDTNGYLSAKVSPATSGVTITPATPIATAYREKFALTVTITGNEPKTCFIDFYAKDDDDLNKGELGDLFCGRIELCVIPDVFTSHEAQRLVDEMIFIGRFADSGTSQEYQHYCLKAADRGLAKLLDNTTDFYAVDRNHERLSDVGLEHEGNRATLRARQIASMGYVYSSAVFDDYSIHDKTAKSILTDEDFARHKYDCVTLKRGSALMEYLKASIQGKLGHHVYYVSVSDDFHTLLLAINNADPASEAYAIYDQHGLTSSSGLFSDIEDGFARQTSWTHANHQLNKGFLPKPTTRLWKIQRKQK